MQIDSDILDKILIAEGIETEEELKTLIKLNVDLGQGFFLDIPRQTFVDLPKEKVEIIKKAHNKKYIENIKSSIYPIIGHLSKQGHCFSPEEKIEDIYETLKLNPTITDLVVIEDKIVMGFMTRTALVELLGGRYGFNLFAGKEGKYAGIVTIKDLLDSSTKVEIDIAMHSISQGDELLQQTLIIVLTAILNVIYINNIFDNLINNPITAIR